MGPSQSCQNVPQQQCRTVPREVCQRSTVSQSAIISQILVTLRPRIDAVVSQALSSQNNRQVTQVSQVSSNRDALIRQQQLLAAKREQERRRLALLQQQQQSVSTSASQSSGGSNLASIFGTGHEVTHSVDGQLKEQYNLGAGFWSRANSPNPRQYSISF